MLPLGKYIANIYTKEKSFVDKIFNPIDRIILKTGKINVSEMTWFTYAISLLITNCIMGVICFIVLLFQGGLGLNPNHFLNINPVLALNIISSFITNTDLQTYSGEATLSNLSQTAVITFFMFTSAASGLCFAAAFMRGLIGKTKTLGNFYVDFVRITTRLLIPLSFIVGIILINQGVIQTFSGNLIATTLVGGKQIIYLGPVASLEVIKNLGTNGGGFFGANAAYPFENPTPISNMIEIILMMLIPSSLIFTFGFMLKKMKQAWIIFFSVMVIFIIFIIACNYFELGNMIGKETRFGTGMSSFFSVVTTVFNTGSANCSLDLLTPLGVLIPLFTMMLSCLFGSDGTGFGNIILYVLLTVFICGLMVGRTPEFLSKKIEAKEMKYIATAILIHPIIILVPTAITLIWPSTMGSSLGGPSYHNFTRIIYEYTSAAANNGSSLSGIDSTNFVNISTAITMFIGRYASIFLLLATAGSLASKQAIPESIGTFKTNTVTFAITLIAIMMIVGALTFVPALLLGPIANHFVL